MPKFTPKSHEQILAAMLAKVLTRTNLSDVGDSSVLKHLLAAAARQDSEQYYQMTLLLQTFSIDTATGEDLDERAKDIQPGILTRMASTKAVGQVVFSRAGVVGTIIIPAGTTVSTGDGKAFKTTAVGTIAATSPEQITGHGVGRDSNLVAVIASVGGAAGNVVAGTVTKMSAKPAGVDTATNPSAFTQGRDLETDDSFRARIKAYVASLSRCTVGSMEAQIVGQQDPISGATPRYVHVWEDPLARGNVTVYVDDGTGTAESVLTVTGENVTGGLAGPPRGSAVGGELMLWLDHWPVKDTATLTLTSSTRGVLVRNTHYVINPASGQLDLIGALTAAETITADYTYYTGLIAFAQKIVDGDPADRTNYPGLRAAGVLVIVKSPQVLLQNVEATLTIQEGYDATTVKASVVTAIKDYINTLAISGDVVRAELIRRIMAVAGLYDVLLLDPPANVTLLDDQLARTTDANITIL
jgi:uncharacterized phage protein gp47/JayE